MGEGDGGLSLGKRGRKVAWACQEERKGNDPYQDHQGANLKVDGNKMIKL
jgi:hypothetical protein